MNEEGASDACDTQEADPIDGMMGKIPVPE